MSAERRATALGLDLAAPPTPTASYVSAVRSGDHLYLAGHGPAARDGVRIAGRLGEGLTLEEGYAAARSVGLQLLRTLRAELGDLDRVERIVKLLCMVNCTPDFTAMPAVANGCSDLLIEVFGEAGRHARSAVGMASLPNRIPVEIELVARVRASAG